MPDCTVIKAGYFLIAPLSVSVYKCLHIVVTIILYKIGGGKHNSSFASEPIIPSSAYFTHASCPRFKKAPWLKSC